jgi:hypothetical protein
MATHTTWFPNSEDQHLSDLPKKSIITAGSFIHLHSIQNDHVTTTDHTKNPHQIEIEIIHLGEKIIDGFRETTFLELDENGLVEYITEECVPMPQGLEVFIEKPKVKRVKKKGMEKFL